MSAPYILVVDDEPDIRNLVQEILDDEGFKVSTADGGEEARKACRARRPDLVLLDIWMPDIDGISLLKEWTEEGKLPFPVIVMSGHGTVETAVEATRLGAYDFLEKPLSLAKLLLTVERALEADKLRKENIGLKEHIRPLLEPIGKSALMQRLREQARRVALHDTWVLFTGESGSGKETFARYMHSCSDRRDGPFVAMSVGSIARENSEVELFGNEEGEMLHYGRLEQANGGILFLQEVTDMDLETQSRLHSAIDGQSFLRVGGVDPVKVDVRIFASTHKDLEQEVQAGRFREDLYYQLNVVPLPIPPLREHCEDISELLAFYVDWYVAQDNLAYRHFSVAAQNRLRNYTWPGNIRELINLVQRLLILGSENDIDLDEVESGLSTQSVHKASISSIATGAIDLPLREAREQFEREYLTHQLQVCEGSVGKLAKLVGMERTNLYRKLRALGVDVKQN